MTKDDFKLTPHEKKISTRLFWRNMFIGFNQSWTLLEGVAWDYVHAPIYREIYKDDDQFWEAMDRNLEFFNTTPNMNGFISGLAVSMEEENARTENFDTKSISSMKVGLMGPMAGIGDTFFSGVWGLIMGAIGLSFAREGNLLAFVISILGMFPDVLIRWYSQRYSYKLGSKYISKAVEEGIMTMFTKASSIMGVTVVGGMIATLVKVPVVLKAKFGTSVFDLQKVLDQIMPGMLPLALGVGCFIMVRKGVSPVKVLIGVVLLGFALTYLGITGAVA